MRRVPLFLVLAMIAAPIPALACSCAPLPDVAASYDEASVVFLGRVISITRTPEANAAGDLTWLTFTEDAEFVIEKAWKNTQVGHHIHFRAENLGSGRCSLSAFPVPEWRDEYATEGVPPEALSGRWIIYAYGIPPFSISMCSRSRVYFLPASSGDEHALDELLRNRQ